MRHALENVQSGHVAADEGVVMSAAGSLFSGTISFYTFDVDADTVQAGSETVRPPLS